MHAGAAAGGAPTDWQCPNTQCLNHTKMVFGTKATCPKCGFSRDQQYSNGGFPNGKADKGMQGGDMPGDWACPNGNCQNSHKLVFAKHTSCPMCGTARNAKQPGDWQCPNKMCVNSTNTVFASKVACPKCGTSRPGSAQGLAGMGGQQPMPGNPGDWQCPDPTCTNHRRMVFAKHDMCPICTRAKPAGGGAPVHMGNVVAAATSIGNALGGSVPQMNIQQVLMALAANTAGGAAGAGPAMGGMRKTRGGQNPGDWSCPNPDCLNHTNSVFAKHASCPKCGADKPMDHGAARERSPYRMGGGY